MKVKIQRIAHRKDLQ